MKSKLPSSFYNPISILGSIIALIAWITLVFLFIMTKTFQDYNVYMEIFTYVVVPGFLIIGLILIAVGMIIRRRNQRKGIESTGKNIFIFNLKESKTRNALIIFISVTILFVLSTIIGSYEAFHYTESNEFCGKLCHKAMSPEYTTYQYSPHASVKCVDCHIGNGVNWFVKAKISGVRQLFHYVTSNYDKPISTPIDALRPAAQTCEKCHWPQKVYTHKLNDFRYFLRDSANTEWEMALDMKLGASTKLSGTTKGIHWHDDPDVEVQYKTNAKHDTIFWVKYINKKTGEETVYEDEEYKKSSADLAKLSTRSMDCMDCHNRPAHEYRSPGYYLNNLFASGKISTSIPWLKNVSMFALKGKFSTRDSAILGLKNKIVSIYEKKYPEIYKKYEKEIAAATTVITNEYLANSFPEMRISSSNYPRHIGHLESAGCFRCHNDRQKSAQGKVISKDCYKCHDFLKIGKKGEMTFCDVNNSVKFAHPIDIENDWQDMSCMECHGEIE